MNKKTKQNKTDETSQWDGFTHPDDMIDHNGNLELAEAFLNIFVAYNQQNIAEGKAWDRWPEWELCLTSMNDDLHFVDKENDSPEILAEREHSKSVSRDTPLPSRVILVIPSLLISLWPIRVGVLLEHLQSTKESWRWIA